jgi:uncharacterized protein YycO
MKHPSLPVKPTTNNEGINMTVFKMGRIVATPGALSALQSAGECLGCILLRHLGNDWGDLDDDDKRANDNALRDGDRILSKYTTTLGVALYVITEADRSATTILRTDEY